MKNTKKSLQTLLSLVLTAAFLFSPFSAVRARAVTQADIDAVQAELDELEAQAQEQQKIVDDLEENKARVVDRKLALDKKFEISQRQIQLLQSQIDMYTEILGEKEAELETAQEAEAAQREQLLVRMRAMEESGNNSYIAFIFESDSLPELLSRLGDVSDIMHYDQTLEAQYTAARQRVEELRNSYAESRAQQEDLQQEVNRKTEELNAQVDAACDLIANLSEQADDAQAEYDAIAQAQAATEARIDELLRQQAAEEEARRRAEEEARRLREQQENNNNNNNSGGSDNSGSSGNSGGSTYAVSLTNLMWPVPGCNIITSRFGYRVSPTAGASSYHGGLDIGAQAGAAIVSAEAGTVILASPLGGYGNCVMVDHGGGIVTLYGHMSSIAVSSGQYVSQGQTIGYVGSTGISTGPHCHFEIRVNGSQTDPAPYFSGLVYYC